LRQAYDYWHNQPGISSQDTVSIGINDIIIISAQ